MGVVLLQHGKGIPVLLHAAQNAFFKLGLSRLNALFKEYEIESTGITLAPTVTACVKLFIKPYTKKAAIYMEIHQILSLRCADENSLVADICDEDMFLEVLSHDDDQQVMKAFVFSYKTKSS